MNKTYRPTIEDDGSATIETTRTVTHQQGTWRWQLRLQTAWYRARYSARCKAWIWKSVARSESWSGGNLRKPHTSADGSLHNRRLTGIELAALAVVRGEC